MKLINTRNCDGSFTLSRTMQIYPEYLIDQDVLQTQDREFILHNQLLECPQRTCTGN